MINRRTFLGMAGVLGLGTVSNVVLGQLAGDKISIAQLIYPGGNWQPHPSALRHLLWEIQKRTAVKTALDPLTVQISTRGLANQPLAYLSGDRGFPLFLPAAIAALRRFLNSGGTLVVDPSVGTNGGGITPFNDSWMRVCQALFPDRSESPIPINHVIYRSFYRLERAVGRITGSPTLYGINVDNRMAVIRADGDLGGAWARDNLGNWEFDVTPGGSRQREQAIRLGVNITMYAICGDYKDELPQKRYIDGQVND